MHYSASSQYVTEFFKVEFYSTSISFFDPAATTFRCRAVVADCFYSQLPMLVQFLNCADRFLKCSLQLTIHFKNIKLPYFTFLFWSFMNWLCLRECFPVHFFLSFPLLYIIVTVGVEINFPWLIIHVPYNSSTVRPLSRSFSKIIEVPFTCKKGNKEVCR